jgi:hypothetical protein
MAFAGGYISLNPKYFKLIAGLFLVIASFLFVLREYVKHSETTTKPMHIAFGLTIGSVIGIVSNRCWRWSFSIANNYFCKLDNREKSLRGSGIIYIMQFLGWFNWTYGRT